MEELPETQAGINQAGKVDRARLDRDRVVDIESPHPLDLLVELQRELVRLLRARRYRSAEQLAVRIQHLVQTRQMSRALS